MTLELSTARDERTAVDKAFSVLHAVGSDGHGAIGVSEVARRTGLSKSTAFRVLQMLERNRAIVRVGTDYQVSSLLSDLGPTGDSATQDLIRDTLTPHLIDLYERTRQTVHLATLQGTEVLYLNKLHGARPASSPSRIGGRAPAYSTAVGKVLLAWNPEGTDETLGSDLRPWTDRTIVRSDALVTVLQDIRRTGIGFDRGESLVGLNCIAAPIVGRSGRPVAAFSISVDRGVIPASYAHALRTVAYAASQSFRSALGRSGTLARTPS